MKIFNQILDFIIIIVRIMQFPVQAWLRITLNHGSITQITILSDGSVIMKSVGDSGFMPSNKVTF
jgi:serine/threonine-protein phosphatase PGAM5